MEEEAAAEHLMSRKGGLIQIKKKKIPKRPFFLSSSIRGFHTL